MPIYGPGGTYRSSRVQRILLSGSDYDYASEAGPLYDNGVVLPAINWKANATSEAELMLEERTAVGWTRVADHEVLRALQSPNEYYDGDAMWRGVQLSWDVRGQAFLIKRRDRLGRVAGFYWCPHFQMRPMANKGNDSGAKLVTHYEYTPFGGSPQDLDVRDVAHLRYGIDPRDPSSGLSPLAATLREVCSDNEASTWLAALLRQGATPGAILVPRVDAQAPTAEQRKRLKDLWNSFVRDRRGEAFMAPLPLDVVTPTFSPQQMEIGKLREVPTARICAALGLDPMVLGLPSENKTYRNYEQAADAAGKRTILPTLRSWAAQLGRQVLMDFGLDPARYRLRWDTRGVSWLQDEADALHARVREDFRCGLIDRGMAKLQIGLEPSEEDQGRYYISQ